MTTRPRKPAPGTPAPGKLALPEVAEMKRRGDRIVMVTAYDAPSGRIADDAGVDLILVGDSAAMVVLGHDSTVPATTDEMIILTRAVNRGARRPLVIADLPFGSYQVSDAQAVETAIRFLKEAGADAVKLEGAGTMLSRVRALTSRRHPGDGPHRPDTADRDDARRFQGPGPQCREGRAAPRGCARSRGSRLLLDRAGGRAGPRRGPHHRSARRSRRSASAPGAGCDGQVLVWHDMLGLYDGKSPRFVKQYAELAPTIRDAVAQYAAEVRDGAFPEAKHTYAMADEELALFEDALAEVHARR